MNRFMLSGGKSPLVAALFLMLLVWQPAFAGTWNKPPTISGTPSTTGKVGVAYAFQPSAKDPEGRTLTFSVSNRPAWASFSKSTGRLSGTPTAAGTFSNIRISVSDGRRTKSLSAFTITVAPAGSTAPVANKPPTITGTPVTSAKAGQPYSFKPTAQDADGDPLTFSITNKPAWATFDASNGTLYGTPTSANVATFANIVIRASDGKATASLPSFAITVAAASTGSITVSWVPPTQNTNGTPVTGLSGFRVYYGTASRQYAQSVLVSSPSLRSVVVEGLSPGTTWYFGVKSVTNTGVESDYSNEAVKTLL
jgi:hypothetical protein